MRYYDKRFGAAGILQTDCPVAIVFGCDECHRPKCDYFKIDGLRGEDERIEE